MVRGVIFDLDGTLISSNLSLDKVRAALGFAQKAPILETIEGLPQNQQQQAHQIVIDHEVEAARSARLHDGVHELIAELKRRDILTAILTRNCLQATRYVVEQLNIDIEKVLTRECAPAKPDPQAVFDILEDWQLDRHQVVYVGDFRFDIELSENAGVQSVLYCPGELPEYHSRANYVISDFSEFIGKVIGH